MNTSSSNSSLVMKSVISLIVFLVIAAGIYLYFNTYVLNTDNSAEISKTQEEIDRDKKLKEMNAPPREDIVITEKRAAEIQSDLRSKPEGSSTSNEEVRGQLVN